MVSGIGPQAALDALQIPIVKALPGVGQNLQVCSNHRHRLDVFGVSDGSIIQDQPFFGVSYKVNVTTNEQVFTSPSFLGQATGSFLSNQTGPLTNLGANLVGEYATLVERLGD